MVGRVDDVLAHRARPPFAEEVDERSDREVERIAQQRVGVPVNDGNTGEIDGLHRRRANHCPVEARYMAASALPSPSKSPLSGTSPSPAASGDPNANV